MAMLNGGKAGSLIPLGSPTALGSPQALISPPALGNPPRILSPKVDKQKVNLMKVESFEMKTLAVTICV